MRLAMKFISIIFFLTKSRIYFFNISTNAVDESIEYRIYRVNDKNIRKCLCFYETVSINTSAITVDS